LYYAHEIQRAQVTEGLRHERFEPKQLSNRRDTRFALDVLALIERLGGVVFAYGVVKPVGKPQSLRDDGLYGSTMQGLMRAFEKYLRQHSGKCGLIILDRRDEGRDIKLLVRRHVN